MSKTINLSSLNLATITHIHTHGDNNLPIPAMAYYINDLDIQRSGRFRGEPTYSISNAGNFCSRV